MTCLTWRTNLIRYCECYIFSQPLDVQCPHTRVDGAKMDWYPGRIVLELVDVHIHYLGKVNIPF